MAARLRADGVELRRRTEWVAQGASDELTALDAGAHGAQVGRDRRPARLASASVHGAYLVGAELRGVDLATADPLGAELRGPARAAASSSPGHR